MLKHIPNVENYAIEDPTVWPGVTEVMEVAIFCRILILFPTLKMNEVVGRLDEKPAETAPNLLLITQLMGLQ